MSQDPLWPRASDWLASGGTRGGPRFEVVGVPLSRTSISPSGAHATPGAVRRALRRFPTFHAGLEVDLERLEVIDHGDLDVASFSGEESVHETAVRLRHAGLGRDLYPRAEPPSHRRLVVLLGGDNAVTRPAMRTLMPLPRSGLLTLDAHHDVRGFHDGPTNGNPVRGLVEDGLPGEHVVQVGIGDLSNSRAYRSWCLAQGIMLVSADESRGRVAAVVREHLDRLALTCEHVYVDLDVDVLDKAFAPGCPGARPGGLAPSDLLAAAAEAGRHPAVEAVDVVEVDAAADVTGATVDIAAMCLLSAAAGFAAR